MTTEPDVPVRRRVLPGAAAVLADAREAKRQEHRYRMTLIAAGSTAFEAAIVLLFAWNGTLPMAVAVGFAVTGTVISGGFALIFRAGWNLRMRDRDMVYPQMIGSFGLQLVFLVLAPNLWVVFLVAVLVTYNFSMISFSERQYTAARIVLGLAMGVALVAGRERFGHPGTSDVTIALLWLFFTLSIHQLTLIGSRFSALRAQLSAKNEQLGLSLAKIRQLANEDELTGVANRRSFMESLVTERARALRTGQTFCVAILDIDRFKTVNDRFGHFVGDDVLKEFCAVAGRELRDADCFARFGGEEFALLMTGDPSLDEAVTAVDRLRTAIEGHDWTPLTPGLTVTTSAGVARWDAAESVEQVLGRADAALYAAKDRGRNRTERA